MTPATVRKLLTFTAWGWFVVAGLSALGAFGLTVGSIALAASPPPDATSTPLELLGRAVGALFGSLLAWTLGLFSMAQADS